MGGEIGDSICRVFCALVGETFIVVVVVVQVIG